MELLFLFCGEVLGDVVVYIPLRRSESLRHFLISNFGLHPGALLLLVIRIPPSPPRLLTRMGIPL